MRSDLHAKFGPEVVACLRLIRIGHSFQQLHGPGTHATAQVDDEAGRKLFEGQERVLEHVQVERVDGGLHVVLARHSMDHRTNAAAALTRGDRVAWGGYLG